MNFLSLINSRHRIDRYRALSSVNGDSLNTNVIVGATDITIECDSIINGSSGIYFINRLDGTSHGFLIRIFDDLTASFGIFGGAFVSFTPITASPNWRRFRFEINTGGNNLVNLYIDDILHDSISIGVINAAITPPISISTFSFDVNIDNIRINTKTFKMNERYGFDCLSTDRLTVMQGSTTNSGQVIYWNNNVIQER